MDANADRITSTRLRTGFYVRSKNGLKLRDRKVQALVRRMRNSLPYLEDSDLPVCRVFAQFEILGDQLYAQLRDRGIFNAEGEPRRVLDELRKLRSTQLQYAQQLGLTPAAR